VIFEDNNSLRDVSTLGQLASIRGVLEFIRSPAITELRLGDLGHLGGLTVQNNPALLDVVLPSLARAGVISIARNDQLHQLSLPALTSVDTIEVFRNAKLPACAVIALFAQIPDSAAQQSGNDEDATCASP
jgi:hypothetical protein